MLNMQIGMEQLGFVGVHVGAGHHSRSKTDQYLDVCNQACKKAIQLLRKGESAVNAANEAVQILENSPHTNAGIGSNLNEDRNVECDACIMDGQSLQFGAVGAVRGIKNPIHFAYQLLQEQNKESHPLGIIPPCILVGPAANKWAEKHGIYICEKEDQMITEESIQQYLHCRNKLEDYETQKQISNIRKLDDVCNLRTDVSDTVGAVVLDLNGDVAAAASSGGLILKQPGRVGQVANYGSGCWAQNYNHDQMLSIATTTSGCGEYLIKTCFAKECANYIISSQQPAALSMKEAIELKYLSSPFLKRATMKLVGIIALAYDPEAKHGEFLWSHTTDTMCVGYMAANDKHPVSKMSRLPKGSQTGSTIMVEGVPIKFSTHRLHN